jgi:hypothetical protein
METTTPPSNIHIALSVGEPVKKREMSEVNDVDAMTPNIISRIPPARSASETALLMFFPFVNQHPAFGAQLDLAARKLRIWSQILFPCEASHPHL